MNRIDYINKINTYASRFVLEVEGFNANNLYHINIHAENFIIPVLNEVFDLNLENLNSTQKKNYPVIDLADFKNKVAFQVTASSSFSKIESTITKFFAHGLHKKFDVLYFYIITQKRQNYDEDKLDSWLQDGFVFIPNEHIIDKDSLLHKIINLTSTQKILTISKIFEHEFSDTQINLRRKEFTGGYLNNESEDIFPNLLPITFPDTFYKAELNIDEEGILAKTNEYLVSIGKIPLKHIRKAKLVSKALKSYRCKTQDWVLFENAILTFRNLYDDQEPYRKIIDKGTITPIECKDFYESRDDNKKVFKHLLRNSLTELCRLKDIEWFGKNEIFRFANNPQKPCKKQVRWKGKREATKTVIFEMVNRKDNHIICFRSLAFRCSFFELLDNWYLVLNPTWSFTNPGGYRQSRFESAYMSGIKRMESNNSVFNYFRFFGYYLTHSDLFSIYYPFLSVRPPASMSLSPRLDEKTWKPVKVVAAPINAPPVDLKEDTELDDNSLFD